LSSLPTNSEVAVQKPKRTMLPVLVVLFIISYGLLTMLVVEQGRTIETQRSLIHDLFSDSGELFSLKSKLAQKQHPGTKAGTATHAQVQAPAAAAPNAPAQAAPRGKASQDKTRVSDNSSKRKALPQKPPKAEYDDPDARRINISI
jgi:hypothetical protein